jgi:hypothetical protein
LGVVPRGTTAGERAGAADTDEARDMPLEPILPEFPLRHVRRHRCTPMYGRSFGGACYVLTICG